MRCRPTTFAIGAMLVLTGLGACGADAAQTHTFQLPFGYRAQVPSDWAIEEWGEDFLFVLPDYARDAQGGLLERVALAWRSAPGIDRPDDPRVIEYFDKLMPDLRLAGSPQARQSGLGPGTLLTFEGSIEGVAHRKQLYVTLAGGDVLFFLYEHNPPNALADRRVAAVEQIVATLAHAPPGNDPAVAGGWRRETTTGSTGVTGNWFATDVRVFIIDADGSVEYGSASTLSAGTRGGYAFGQADPNVLRGRYLAAGGKLLFKWQGGVREVYDYAVIQHEGVPHLKLQQSGGRPVYYRRIE